VVIRKERGAVSQRTPVGRGRKGVLIGRLPGDISRRGGGGEEIGEGTRQNIKLFENIIVGGFQPPPPFQPSHPYHPRGKTVEGVVGLKRERG
jgi:hypothetical protein